MEDPTLDLHGLTVLEAERRVSAFLRTEQARGTAAVRIVTGHGTGALKRAIRDLLAQHPCVASTRPSLRTDAALIVVLRAPLDRGR